MSVRTSGRPTTTTTVRLAREYDSWHTAFLQWYRNSTRKDWTAWWRMHCFDSIQWQPVVQICCSRSPLDTLPNRPRSAGCVRTVHPTRTCRPSIDRRRQSRASVETRWQCRAVLSVVAACQQPTTCRPPPPPPSRLPNFPSSEAGATQRSRTGPTTTAACSPTRSR